MNFITYYMIGLTVVLWLFVLDAWLITPIEKLAKEMDTTILNTFLMIGVSTVIGALVWPILVIWELYSIACKYIFHKNN